MDLKLLCRNVYHHETMCCAQDPDQQLRAQGHTSDQSSKIGSIFRVRSITLLFLDGFRNYFAEMLTIMRQCVVGKIQVHNSKVTGQRSKIESIFHVWSITVSFLDGFRSYFSIMLTIMSHVTSKRPVCSSKSRSHLVRGQR